MGRQINFFATLDDETAFCEFLLSTPGVSMLPARTNALPPPRLVPPLPRECPQPLDRSLVLWNANLFAGPEYVKHHIGFFYTAGSQEGGIEFTRSIQDRNIIRAGRLWASVRGRFLYNLDGTVRDPEKKRQFDSWLNSLFGWIRKRYVKYADLFYIGPGAVHFQEMGGKLGPTYAEMDDPSKIERRFF